MNSSKQIGIAFLFLIAIKSSFGAQISDTVKFDNIAISITMKILKPQGIEKRIISKGWSNEFESKDRIFLLKKYDESLCTPLEDSPQLRRLGKEIYTEMIALAFLSEEFGSDRYLELAKYHMEHFLNYDEDHALYQLLNDILDYWLRMKTFDYHETDGLTTVFLNSLKKAESTYKKDTALAAKVNELKGLITVE